LERNRRLAVFCASAQTSTRGESTKDPVGISHVPAGFSAFFKSSGSTLSPAPRTTEWLKGRIDLPISALLARIRMLIPSNKDGHYDEIARGFGTGALRAPTIPMSDAELGRAIAEFLKDAPTAEAVSTLGRRIDPSSPV
jgi:hypothetical protein